MLKARDSRVWLGMLLSGLAMGAYVLVAWPEATHPARPSGEAMLNAPTAERVVRVPAAASSTSAGREPELYGVLGDIYPLELYFYELSPAPLLDALIAAPQPAVAN